MANMRARIRSESFGLVIDRYRNPYDRGPATAGARDSHPAAGDPRRARRTCGVVATRRPSGNQTIQNSRPATQATISRLPPAWTRAPRPRLNRTSRTGRRANALIRPQKSTREQLGHRRGSHRHKPRGRLTANYSVHTCDAAREAPPRCIELGASRQRRHHRP